MSEIDHNEYNGNSNLRLSIKSEYHFISPTCGTLYRDINMFLKESQDQSINEEDRKRYARTAIMFMPFFYESLEKALFDMIIDKFKNEPQLPQLKRYKNDKFLGIYAFFKKIPFEKENKPRLPLNRNAIDDLFLIRNQIIAHPQAWSIAAGTGVPKGKGLTIDKKEVLYKQLKNLPNRLEDFTANNAIEIYTEMKIFLREYYNLISSFLPDHSFASYFN